MRALPLLSVILGLSVVIPAGYTLAANMDTEMENSVEGMALDAAAAKDDGDDYKNEDYYRPVYEQIEGYDKLSKKHKKRLHHYLKDREPVEKTEYCLPGFREDDFTIISDDIFLYHSRSKTLYMNQPKGGCNGAERNTLISNRFGSQICSGDIMRVSDLTIGMTTGSCALNDFVPWVRKDNK